MLLALPLCFQGKSTSLASFYPSCRCAFLCEPQVNNILCSIKSNSDFLSQQLLVQDATLPLGAETASQC